MSGADQAPGNVGSDRDDPRLSEYERAVLDGTEDMVDVSVGALGACDGCAALGTSAHESHFSWSPCGICRTQLGGDRHVWHWTSSRVERGGFATVLEHEDDACTDCLHYIANGTIPENWRRR